MHSLNRIIHRPYINRFPECCRMRLRAELLYRCNDPYLAEFYGDLNEPFKTLGIYAVIIGD